SGAEPEPELGARAVPGRLPTRAGSTSAPVLRSRPSGAPPLALGPSAEGLAGLVRWWQEQSAVAPRRARPPAAGGAAGRPPPPASPGPAAGAGGAADEPLAQALERLLLGELRRHGIELEAG